jgi:parallel beta-helix repeat protein
MKRIARFLGMLLAIGCCNVHADAATVYVSPGGHAQAAGTLDDPLADITQALDKAGSGGTVLLRGGVYRQRVTLMSQHSGTPGHLSTLMAYGEEKPILKGSDVVTDWTRHQGAIWKHAQWNLPSQQVFADDTLLMQIGTQQVFGDFQDKMQRRVVIGKDIADMRPGSFFYDEKAKVLYIWLPDGSDPNHHLIEAATRDYIIRPEIHQSVNYVALKNLIFRHANSSVPTEEKPYNYTMVSVGNDGLIDHCDIQWGDFRGVMMGRHTQLLNSIIANNGNDGVDAGPRSPWRVADCTITGNGHRMYLGWHCGGMKLIPDAYGVIENNLIADNWGPGVWFDWADCGGQIVIRNNRILNNRASQMIQGKIRHLDVAGIKIEASRNVLIYNNLISGNEGNGIIIMASADVEIFNNTLIGNTGMAAIQVGGVPRGMKTLGGGCTLDHINIINNAIVDNPATYDLSIQLPVEGVSDKVTFKLNSNHNLFYRFGGPIQLHTGGTYTGFKPQVVDLKEWQKLTGFDTNSMAADPMFIDMAKSDYRPGRNSPMRDAGSGFGVAWAPPMFEATLDITGISRQKRWDIGAYESLDQKGVALALLKGDDQAWVDDQLPDGAVVMGTSNRSGDPRRFWLWSNVEPKPSSGALCARLVANKDELCFTGFNLATAQSTAGMHRLAVDVWLSPDQTPDQLFIAVANASGQYVGGGIGFAQDSMALPQQISSIDPDTNASLEGDAARNVQLTPLGKMPAAGQWTTLHIMLPTDQSLVRGLLIGVRRGILAVDRIRLVP